MMSSSILFLCCLLTFSLHLLSQHTSYYQDVMPTRKLSMSDLAHDHENHDTQVRRSPVQKKCGKNEMQVADEVMDAKDDSMALEHTSNSYSPQDLIYHIDYHGVTTHPTPKHPKP